MKADQPTKLKYYTMRQVIPLCILLVLVLVDCSGTRSAVTTPSDTTPPQSFSTPFSTVVRPTPTISQTPSLSPTPLWTSTPSIPPEARLRIHCLDVAMNPSQDSSWRGVIILDDYSPDKFLFDIATGIRNQIAKPNENLLDFTVAPDREKMAYERVLLSPPTENVGNVIKNQLIVATADNQILKTIPWEEGWVGIPGWLDDDRLVINIAGNDPDESTRRKAKTLLMLNPFTGERRVLRADFPNIWSTYPVFEWEGWSETAYDPALTRVVYAGPGYVLWDLESSRALATLDAFPIHSPRWSPDGSQVVMAADPNFGQEPQPGFGYGYELFSMSRDGQSIAQITNLLAYYPAADMWSYSWSPTGDKLAFWLSTNPGSVGDKDYKSQRLAVLDLDTEIVTEYCIPLDDYRGDPLLDTFPFGSSGVTAPIWSPDGQQLLVESRYAKDASRVILIDITQDIAVQIAETMTPVGWMKSQD